jgi:hypothetical protein
VKTFTGRGDGDGERASDDTGEIRIANAWTRRDD